ncbi:MAG: hypothetical protein JWQ71_4820 [Pedosphaera sp.]|nr:hypothetical protein [Pedosphaera sp.]
MPGLLPELPLELLVLLLEPPLELLPEPVPPLLLVLELLPAPELVPVLLPAAPLEVFVS